MFVNPAMGNMYMQQQQLQVCRMELEKYINQLYSSGSFTNEQYNTLKSNFNNCLNSVFTEWAAMSFNPNMFMTIANKWVTKYMMPTTYFNPTVNMMAYNPGSMYAQNTYGMSQGMSNPDIASYNQDMWGKSSENNVGLAHMPSSTNKTTARISQEQAAVPIGVNQDSIGKSIAGVGSMFRQPMPSQESTPSVVRVITLPRVTYSDKEREERLNKYINRTKVYKMQIDNREVTMSEFSLSDPMNSAEHAIAEVKDSAPEFIASNEYAHLIKYGELHVVKDTPYTSAVDTMKRCMDIYESTKGPGGIGNLPQLIKELNAVGDLGRKLKVHAYNLFNECAAVSMLKCCSDGKFRSLKPVYKDSDFTEYLTESNGDNPEAKYINEMKQDPAYVKRLQICIAESFGALFDASLGIKYLDIKEDTAKQYILTNPKVGYRFGKEEPISARVFYSYATADELKEVDQVLQTLFPLIINKKIFFHNLNIDAPDWNNINVLPLAICNTQALISKVLEMQDTVLMSIDDCDYTQYKHPLIIGSTFEGTLIYKRMI